jgi:glycosyltransferase involved in cell wall biosynthesis
MKLQNNNKKLKILYLITKSNFGGAQRYVHDLAVNMQKRGFDVSVAFGGDGLLKNKLEQLNIKTISIQGLGRNVKFLRDFILIIKLFSIYRKIKPDIVHLNSSKIGGLGAFTARCARIRKIIFTAHGWPYKEKRGLISILLIKFFSWLTVLLSHKTIVVSKDDLGRSPKLFVKKKIKLIYNGISEINFKNRNAARNLLKRKMRGIIPNRAVWLGTISELHRNKGLKNAVRAVSEIMRGGKNIFFIIIGEGEERQLLERFITECGIENRTALVGQIDNAAILLPAFDIFIIPSVKEGLPYTLLEAGLAGLPTVATAAGGAPEVIDDMESGILVRPQSAKELEEALIYLLENNEKKVSVGAALKEKIKRDFTIEKMIDETVTIYE